jgi:hypothetical protein
LASRTCDQQAVTCCVQRQAERSTPQEEAHPTSMREEIDEKAHPGWDPWTGLLYDDARALELAGRSIDARSFLSRLLP